MGKTLKSLAAIAAVLTAGSAVHAAVIHYADLSAGGITVNNIYETNDSASDEYYGPAVLTGATVSFPMSVGETKLFKAAAIGASGGDFLDVKLSFDVTSNSPLTVAAFLDEVGDYQTVGTGSAGDGASILIFGPGDTLLASATSSFTTSANTVGHWESTAGATDNLKASSFHVVIDNILHATTITSSDFALIEKKGLSVDLGVSTNPNGGGPGTPEPASLGLLGLGAMALIGRRRKA